jgi:hypothetical protein
MVQDPGQLHLILGILRYRNNNHVREIPSASLENSHPYLVKMDIGIWGALLASPIAGVLQALVVALWRSWRETHPEQFAQAEQQIADKTDESLTDHPAITSKDTMSDDR